MTIKMRERRTEEKIKRSWEWKKKTSNIKKKAAKDLDKANAALNTADLIIPKPEFEVDSHVKTIVNTLPETNPNESELVEDNVIYK